MRLITGLICSLLCLGALASEDCEFSVVGLEEPAEIVVDEWGIPHIYANTHYDAFFVQGFNAARDRLWQIDTWRRRGLGQLAEVFGPQYVAQDRASRRLLYRGDMYREWLAYGSDAKRIAEAFTSGINAYIALIAEHPELMPPEFDLLGYEPALWQASDTVIIRSHGISQNVGSEVQRARILCLAGKELASAWRLLEPDWELTVPDGLDPCDIPVDVLDEFSLGRRDVSFDSVAVAANESLLRDRLEGSNNWVVAPSRSATGRPVLADDPHRQHRVPSLRYIAHLVAPGMDVIGAGEPALPGISIGHNDKIAFGLTVFYIDQSDLYVYDIRDGKYRYKNSWQEFDVINETIAVSGEDDVDVELKFTRHGPVVFENEKHAFAIRLAFLEPGMAPYFGSVEYMRASNWREFVAALNRWGSPSENQVYADIDGNIGYKPAGLFPNRPNWDGLLPVPGDGRYEWDGFHDMDVLPEEYNPSRGFTGTANSMNLPPDYPIDRYKVGFDWVEPWRYDRMWEVLSGQEQHSLTDSTALQRDYQAQLAIDAIGRIPESIDGQPANLLRKWDGNLSPDSAAGALFMVWWERHLQPAMSQVLLPGEPASLSGMHDRSIIELVANPEFYAIVEATLDAAWADTSNLLGADTDLWAWGSIHHTEFEHPLLRFADGDLAEQMRLPPYARGGSGFTVNATSHYSSALRVNAGASYRQVIDVGNWDASTMTNAPGQSGDPRSPYYDNLLEGWATEQDFPLLYTKDAIMEHKAFTITLKPSTSEGR